jgi:protein-disulfide isomerase
MKGRPGGTKGRMPVSGAWWNTPARKRLDGKDPMRIVFYSLIALLVTALPGVVQPAAAQSDTCVGGRPTAPVKIEVFSDYQCPACRDFYLSTMRSVLSDYADAGKVCVVYREFPLSQHQHAQAAAKFGVAAMRMGQRYWAQVTDALYNKQDQWAQDGKIEPVIAAALNKEDMARLQKEMSSPSVNTTITSDMDLGKKMEVNSTPTFFIYAKGKTEKVAGGVQYAILRRYLDSLLQ